MYVRYIMLYRRGHVIRKVASWFLLDGVGETWYLFDYQVDFKWLGC